MRGRRSAVPARSTAATSAGPAPRLRRLRSARLGVVRLDRHYRAIETDLDFTGPAHGDAGPIPVRRTPEFIGSTAAFVDSGQRPVCLDSGPERQWALRACPGVGAVPLNIVDGVRTGSGRRIPVPVLGRPNLTC